MVFVEIWNGENQICVKEQSVFLCILNWHHKCEASTFLFFSPQIGIEVLFV
jgi:hypothetical protein